MAPLALHIYASDYLEAALALKYARTGFSPVASYLICHAIEVALKAYLSGHGLTLADLAADYRHDLDRLLAEALRRDLLQTVSLTVEHRHAVIEASEYYRNKVFEYPALRVALEGYSKHPDLSILDSAAAILVHGLKDFCLAASE